jgi:hypothetical protein
LYYSRTPSPPLAIANLNLRFVSDLAEQAESLQVVAKQIIDAASVISFKEKSSHKPGSARKLAVAQIFLAQPRLSDSPHQET